MDRYDAILEHLKKAQSQGLDSVAHRLDAIVESLGEKDDPSHLVLVSSKAQGYVIPLLLTARDAGLSQIRVGHAEARQLWPTQFAS